MIGTAGRHAMRAVDDLQRAVVLGAGARDEEHVDVARLEGAHGLVDAVGHPEQLEARVVGHRPLDVEGIESLDGDECSDGALHRRSPYRLPVDLPRGAERS